MEAAMIRSAVLACFLVAVLPDSALAADAGFFPFLPPVGVHKQKKCHNHIVYLDDLLCDPDPSILRTPGGANPCAVACKLLKGALTGVCIARPKCTDLDGVLQVPDRYLPQRQRRRRCADDDGTCSVKTTTSSRHHHQSHRSHHHEHRQRQRHHHTTTRRKHHHTTHHTTTQHKTHRTEHHHSHRCGATLGEEIVINKCRGGHCAVGGTCEDLGTCETCHSNRTTTTHTCRESGSSESRSSGSNESNESGSIGSDSSDESTVRHSKRRDRKRHDSSSSDSDSSESGAVDGVSSESCGTCETWVDDGHCPVLCVCMCPHYYLEVDDE